MPVDCDDAVATAVAPIPRKRTRKRYKPQVRDIDQRTIAARRARELVDRLAAETANGHPTAGQAELIQRAVMLGVLAGDAEVAIARGTPIDVSAYCTLANTQRRVLIALGLHQQAKDLDAKLIEQSAEDESFRKEVMEVLRQGEDDNAAD